MKIFPSPTTSCEESHCDDSTNVRSSSASRARRISEAMLSLPANLQDVADVIGTDAALAIALHAHNRTRCVAVPKRAKPDHWLLRLIGAERFAKLQRVFGGDRFFPSRAKIARLQRDAEIVHAFEAGESIDALAKRHGLKSEMVKLIVHPLRERIKAQRAARDRRAAASRKAQQKAAGGTASLPPDAVHTASLPSPATPWIGSSTGARPAGRLNGTGFF